jgi:hypothetical protein
MPLVVGDREVVRTGWEDTGAFGTTYIWQMLESFCRSNR